MLLEGVRVADFTQVWAGPHGTRILADLGAEVIKVESIQRIDPGRGSPTPPGGHGNYPGGDGGVDPWNRFGPHNAISRNKLSLTLDMSRPEGRLLARRLIAISDVFVENYRHGVVGSWGLDYDSVRALNESIVYVTMPAFGSTGPERDYVAYGVTQEPLSGMHSITGYVDGPPMKSGINHGDPVTSLHTVSAILAALLRRQKTGAGSYIEVAHLESMVSLVGEYVLQYSLNGEIAERRGNRSEGWVPQAVYQCEGVDNWIAVSVQDDNDWRALCEFFGLGELYQRVPTLLQRHREQDAIDRAISEKTRVFDKRTLMMELQRRGIAAGAVLNAAEVFEDPQVAHNQTFIELARQDGAPHRYPGLEFRFSRTQPQGFRPAPSLGQDNDYVLGELLGLSSWQLADLRSSEIIGETPLEVLRRRRAQT